MAVRTNNDLLIVGRTTAGLQKSLFALGQIQDDAWNHVVAVYDKSVFAVYLNGQRVEPVSGPAVDWGGNFLIHPIGVTRIGAERDQEAEGFFFDGFIEDTRIYNRTLSAAEVLN